jgi:DHA1 family tetracycline resistance protein-like MFS transporter
VQKRYLTAIFLIVFVNLVGFGLILPLIPFYAETFGASPTVVGLLVSSYAAAQLIGAPVLGRLSDRHGRRPILLISLAGTFIGFLLLGLAEPLGRWLAGLLPAPWLGDGRPAIQNSLILGLLFASRILDGLTGGNISVAQAYITDVTDESNRARGLGLIGAAFGLGFIIGPALGGALSAGQRYALPAYVAAALSALNLLLVYVWLPESLTATRRAEIARQPQPTISLRYLWRALQRPRVGPLLHIRFFFGLAFAMFTGIFALYAQYRLGLDSQQTGYLLAYVGLLVVLVQGVAIGRLTDRFSEYSLILSAVTTMAGALLAWALTPNVPVLLVVLIPIAVSSGILNTVINSALTKVVYFEEVGGALGLSAALESATRALSPVIGGLLLDHLGPGAPGVAGALIMTWVVAFTLQRLIRNPDPPLPRRLAPDPHPTTEAPGP